MMEKHKRPLIDRPRYVFKHNDVINKNLKKRNKAKRKSYKSTIATNHKRFNK